MDNFHICYFLASSLQPWFFFWDFKYKFVLFVFVFVMVAIAGDGCVYSWGRGMFGRLGTGLEADELFPVRVNFDCAGRSKEERLKFVGVAAGAYHSLALAG